MRVLFTTSPGYGHIFPVISTAWAVRASGHEVLLATSGNVGAAAGAGVPVVDVAPGTDFAAIFSSFHAEHAEMAEQARKGSLADGSFATRLFAAVSDAMVDGTVRVAEQWRPDLVIHSLLQEAGPLVAGKLGVPAVNHGFGIGIRPEMSAQLTQNMWQAYQRHGVSGPPEIKATINVAPPSMMMTEALGWPMRYVPYNGGGVLPDWLVATPSRPRIAVTLGTALPQFQGLGALGWLADVGKEIDAEFVLAIGDADPTSLGELPPNVRPAGWVPLGVLLQTCSATIHHGGSGSMLTALDAGVPQLVLPAGADQFINAEAVHKRGVGIAAEQGNVDATMVSSLLTDEGFRSASAEVKAEMAAMPTPVDVVPRLVELAS